jgi:hypothetical protein
MKTHLAPTPTELQMQFLKIISEFAENNVYLSGSLALQMQQWNTGRLFSDIDLFIPFRNGIPPHNRLSSIIKLVREKLPEYKLFKVEHDDYLDDDYVRHSYRLEIPSKLNNLMYVGEFKFDLFTPCFESEKDERMEENSTNAKFEDGFTMPALDAKDIICFKVRHAMDNNGHWSEKKQMMDLIRFFSNNI